MAIFAGDGGEKEGDGQNKEASQGQVGSCRVPKCVVFLLQVFLSESHRYEMNQDAELEPEMGAWLPREYVTG